MKRSLFITHGLLLALVLAMPVAGTGCSDDSQPSGDYTSIKVLPTPAKIAIGGTQRFIAQGVYANGTSKEITNDCTWASSSTTVATMSGPTATGVSAGTTTITASFKSLKGTADLTVAERKLIAIQVTPPSSTIAAKTTTKLTATANYDDSTTADVTDTATWSSGTETVATVSKGTVTGVKAGTAVITAELSSVKGTAVVIVSTGVVKSIEVTPAAPTIVKGTTQQFQATAILEDNTKQNVTGQVTWASATTSVATIDTAGIATGVAKGTSVISATLGTITGSTTLTVSDAVLDKIEVTPPAASANIGGANVNFTATAVFTDKTTQNVTATATWASSATAVATIDATGAAKPLTAGTTQITATYQGKTSNQATLIVTGAVVVSIAVTPNPKTIAKGTTQQYQAIATMSSGPTQDLTSAVSWQSSNTAVATITAGGLATGVTAGTSNITASYSGVTSNQAALTVTAATLATITINPSSAQTLAVGATVTFTAQGTFSDTTTQDITTQVTWLAAPITFVAFTANVAKGLAVGTSSVTASLSGITSNAVAVTVTPATLKSIAVTPDAPAALPMGATLQFVATGTYTDNTTAVITDTVLWASSVPAKASISNAAGTKGIATALVSGSTDITATLGTIVSPAVKLTIQSATTTLVFITLDISQIVLNKGVTQSIVATGHYSDGSTLNISNQVSTLLATTDNTGAVVNAYSATKVGSPDHINVLGLLSTAAFPAGGIYPAGQGLLRVYVGSVETYATVKVKDTTVTSVAVNCAAPLNCVPVLSSPAYKVGCIATATFSDSTTDDVTTGATWVSSDTAVASNPAVGGTPSTAYATVVGAGTTVITAAFGGKTSAATAVPNATINAAVMTLSSITVSPANPSQPAGNEQQFTATGSFTGTGACAGPVSFNITAQVTWSESTSGVVASISNAAFSEGLAKAKAPGTSVIIATRGGTSISGSTNFIVNTKCLKDIAIDLTGTGVASNKVPSLVVVPLKVNGYFSDAPTTPVAITPGSVGSWSSSAISPTTWLLDVGTTDPGQLTFTVSSGTCGGTALSKSVTLTIDAAAVFNGVTLNPAAATIVPGASQDFVATATYGGGYGPFNVSSKSVWGNAPVLAGLAHGAAPATAAVLPAERFTAGATTGATEVYATYKTKTAVAEFTVSGSPGIKSVVITAVTPANPGAGFPVGLDLAFTATVTYNDNSSVTNPTGTTFTSSDSTKLLQVGTTNVFKTVAVSGTTNPTVKATYSGIDSVLYPVLINAATLTNMTFSEPDPTTLPRNVTKPLTINGLYSNSTTFDISALVARASGNDTIVIAAAGGTGTVITTYNTTTTTPVTLTFIKDAVTKTLGVIVSGACYTSLALSGVPGSLSLMIGEAADITAMATPTSGAAVNVTATCTWSASNATLTNVGQFGTAGAEVRRYQGAAAGASTLSCILAGAGVCEGGNPADTSITATSGSIAVSGSFVSSIRIEPAPIAPATNRRVPNGETLQLTAFATMSDGALNNDITATSTWTFSGTSASVSDAAGSKGLLTAHATTTGLTIVTVTNVTSGVTKQAQLIVDVQACGAPAVTISTSATGKLPKNQVRDYTASALYGTPSGCTAALSERTVDVTKTAGWAVTDSLPVSPVVATSLGAGKIRGDNVGTANAQATYKSVLSNKLAFEVVAVTLQSLSLSPSPSLTIPFGASGAQTVSVTAIWTDGTTTYNVTPPVVSWTIGTASVINTPVLVAGTNNKDWTVQGVAATLPASTTLYAWFTDASGTVTSNTITANVTNACLTGISLNAPGDRPAGVPFALTYTCTASDGTHPACTPTFSKVDATSIIDDYATKFTAEGVARIAPTATVGQSATMTASVTGCAGATKTSNSVTIAAKAGVLSSVALSGDISIKRGTKGAFTATGTYTLGGGTFPLTLVATYTSSNLPIATPDNDGTGNLTAKYVDGSTVVTASYAGVMSGPRTLTVSGKTVTAIAITADPNLVGGTAANATFPKGGFTLQLYAQATYSDLSTGDESAAVGWSLNTPIVTGTTFLGTPGLLSTGSAGGAQVVAVTYPAGCTVACITATFTVNIVDADLSALTIVDVVGGPAGTSVAAGLLVPYRSQATLLGSAAKYWVTRDLTWTPTTGAIGYVSNGVDAGKFQAVAPGIVTLGASKGSVSAGPVAITVTNAVPQYVFCYPLTLTLPINNKAQLYAKVHNSDGTEPVVTADNWVSTNDLVVAFATSDPMGVVTSIASGVAYAVPTYGNLTATSTPERRCQITVP